MLQRFLDPATLASISGLDLVAKTVVDGFVAGLHRSPDYGFSQEFAEYRAYTPGDDLRHVDWNVFARTERVYLKRYRGETNTQLLILLDTSASMGLRLARREQARLRALPGRVALLPGARAARCRRPDRLRRRCEELRRALHAPGAVVPPAARHREGAAGHAYRFREALHHFLNFMHRRGIVVVISDFYERPEVIIKTVEPLRFRGNEVILFHVLDPQEIAPKFREPVLLTDMEDQRHPGSLSGIRAQRIPAQDRPAHRRRCATRPRRAGLDYFLMDTGRPLDEGLREYLSVRQGRM